MPSRHTFQDKEMALCPSRNATAHCLRLSCQVSNMNAVVKVFGSSDGRSAPEPQKSPGRHTTRL